MRLCTKQTTMTGIIVNVCCCAIWSLGSLEGAHFINLQLASIECQCFDWGLVYISKVKIMIKGTN